MDNPTKAQMWLTSIETIFRWETAERMLGGDVSKITWEQFEESFYAKFFSANVRYTKQQEFLNLELATHADALRLALVMSLHERANQYKAARREATPGLFQQHRQELVAARKTVRELPACRSCGRYHGGRCLAGSGVCFRYKQSGHTIDFCPQKLLETTSNQTPTSQQGRGFATTRQEAEQAGTVVTSMLPILGHFAFILFDSRSSHSFISLAFVQHVCLEVEPLSSILFVSTSSGEVMLSKDKVKACQVEIVNHVLYVTLMVLDMQDFDVILGMDWLSVNHASIDCSRKEVVFNPLSAASFKFKEAGTVVLPKVISAMKASKLLNQGTWSILGSVVDTRESKVSMSSKPVVREYPDVFPDELPGLPPPREIDSAIELEPGIALI
ncbi:gag protease polyprotein [Cucumis melo var. makuwa]|uniref:Gag protease polyprotein n=1 Tax=Cucumis melo var. makuwa TaxID=1194695 RepID=A0A5A7UKB9_CUCMM|nr:gag protease polyprotein [Cucumis melo var. makuwa]